MRAKIEVDTPEKKFVPFALHIEMETVAEAQVLWHRLNLRYANVFDGASGRCYIPLVSDSSVAWDVLDGHMEKNNYKGK